MMSHEGPDWPPRSGVHTTIWRPATRAGEGERGGGGGGGEGEEGERGGERGGRERDDVNIVMNFHSYFLWLRSVISLSLMGLFTPITSEL